MKLFLKVIVVSMFTAFCSFSAIAQAPADVQVEVLGQSNPYVYTPYVYRVRASNVGGTRAENVSLTIDMPLTDTSPTQFILGRLSSISSNCQIVSNKIECSLGRINPGRSKTVRFTFVIPVSTKTLSISATGTADVDANPNNDADTMVFNMRHHDLIISSAVDVINQHCTGTNLTSFYECVLTPTSVTDHPTTLNGDGSITFQAGNYTGSWYQPTPKELVFNYTYGSIVLLEFHGYAVSANCFEGLSTFPPRPQYVSPYSVCIQ